jgi:hypothetical protein
LMYVRELLREKNPIKISNVSKSLSPV